MWLGVRRGADRGEGGVVQSTRSLVGSSAGTCPLALRTTSARPALARRVAHVASDGALVWLAFWLAHTLRYRFEVGGTVYPWDEEPFATFYRPAALGVAFVVVVFLVRGVYRLPRWTGFLDEALLIAGGVTTAMASVVLLAYFLQFAPSRLLFMYAWAGTIALLLAKRGLAWWVRRLRWARGLGVDRVLVVGAGPAGRRVMQAMVGRPVLGYRLVGYLDDGAATDGLPVATERRVVRAERLGRVEDVGRIAEARRIDEVIVALPVEAQTRVLPVLDECRERGVTVRVVPDFYQLALDRVDLGEVAGVPLIGFKDARISGWNEGVKRAMDLAVALTVLTVAALPMLLIAYLIRHDSPGPVLLRQRRVGKDGVPFSVIKFRSMVADAEDRRATLMAEVGETDPRLVKLRHDPRQTRIERLLRRWRLDELPQFWHVLSATMSVVGPRPPLPEEVARYEDWHRQRLLVRPGLTRLWQVNGRTNLTFDEMLRLDLY